MDAHKELLMEASEYDFKDNSKMANERRLKAEGVHSKMQREGIDLPLR